MSAVAQVPLSRPVRLFRRAELTTPHLIKIATGVIIALAVLLSVVMAVSVSAMSGGLDQIRTTDGPGVSATSDLYFAANDMDAQVANVLLAGSDPALRSVRGTALSTYEARRGQADADFQKAAKIAGPKAQAALRSALDAYGRYQGLAAQALLLEDQGAHPAGTPSPAALGIYRNATDLLKNQVLPAVDGITTANAADLETTYNGKSSDGLQAALFIFLVGVAITGVLIGLQVMLASRFKRTLNPPLALATLIALAATIFGMVVFSGENSHLKVAKKDAFDSVLALSRAQAISYDANANESRYLVDPSRRSYYNQGFLADSLRLAAPPGTSSLSDYATAISALTDEDLGQLALQGYFGAEFHNLTFPGESESAATFFKAYSAYQADDNQIRHFASAGHLREAIQLDVGQSNDDFAAYDQALTSDITINMNAFVKALNDGKSDLGGWTAIPWITAVLVAGLAVIGVRPRLLEYR